MAIIHEIQQHLIVDTPFGKAQALMIIDYGIHLNTIWVCASYSNGKIRHFDSNQISLETNYTLTFNTKNKIMKEEKEVKVKKPKEKLHSNRIRMILEEIGMTQQELADITLDGNTAHLSRIINGQRRCISLPIAIKIANALNKPVEEIFIYKQNETKKD